MAREEGAYRRETDPGRISAFETIGLPALSTAAELRRVNERARIEQAMGNVSSRAGTGQIIQRLLNDSRYRLHEAAAWYFSFRSTAEAQSADAHALMPHDQVLAIWHSVYEDAAQGYFDLEEFEQACTAVAELLNNPQAWQALEGITGEDALVGTDPDAVATAARTSVVRWIAHGLFAIAGAGLTDDALQAAEVTLSRDLPDEVYDALTAAVLTRAAGELTQAAAAAEVRLVPLLDKVEDEPSVADALGAAAEDLLNAAHPWWALVEVFDEDPDSGEEGRALDHVAGLLRRSAVALVNHAQDFQRADKLIWFAQETAQSSSLKDSLDRDLQQVRYLAARSGTVHAPQGTRSGAPAGTGTREPRRVAIPWKTVGFVAVLATIIAIRAGAAGLWGGESETAGEGSAPVDDGLPIDASDAEGQALDLERLRLDGVESDVDGLAASIDQLQRDLDETEAAYPNGAPGYIVDQYEADRRRHNALVDQYNDMLAEYQADVVEFNRRVAEYNQR